MLTKLLDIFLIPLPFQIYCALQNFNFFMQFLAEFDISETFETTFFLQKSSLGFWCQMQLRVIFEEKNKLVSNTEIVNSARNSSPPPHP